VTGGLADLHVHSSASDGTDAPARVVARARELGLAAIALTDHDTVGGLSEAFEAGHRLGIDVIPGIELSAMHKGREVHLLGYFIDPANAALLGTLAGLQEERERRAERIVARLQDLGLRVTLDEVRSYAGGKSIGRPHVADALVNGGHLPSQDVVWAEYLRQGGKAYVDRRRPGLDEAIELVRGAGGVTSIAHPTVGFTLAEIESDLAASGVNGLETIHPRLTAQDTATLRGICRRHGLVATGGSDCHGGGRDRRESRTAAMGGFNVTLETVEELRSRAV
jgi:predicted metal-dependent phosphoesterase TrpH